MASFNSHETYVVRDECAHKMKHNKQQQQQPWQQQQKTTKKPATLHNY